MELQPLTIKAARRYVAEHHRHNLAPVGALFALAAEKDGKQVGVVIVGRPIARHMDDGTTAEVVRLTTTGTPNACSFLYGAAWRAARALGYRRLLTYTLASEPGTSLRAAGWTRDADVDAASTWSRASRPRAQVDLFGNERRPPEAKVRWTRTIRREKETT